MTSQLVVMGIDPGIANPGVVILVRSGRQWMHGDSRALSGQQELIELVMDGARKAHAICYEKVTNAPSWGANGHGSAGIIGCEWLAQAAAYANRIPCVGLAPSTWRKRLTGNGKAGKELVERFVRAKVAGIPKVFSSHRFAACGVAIAGSSELGLAALTAARTA